MKIRRRARRDREGLTLLEIMIVVAILGVIAAMVIPQVMGRQEDAMIKTTRTSISGLEDAIKMYAADNGGKYPEGNGDRVYELLLNPSQKNGRDVKPYLEKMPRDAWGRPIQYQFPSSKIPKNLKPALWSAGSDGQDDGGRGDDINNWDDLE